MRAICNRILAAMGAGGLAANGLAGCGGTTTAGMASDASEDPSANGILSPDGTVPGSAVADAHTDGYVQVIGTADGSAVTDASAHAPDWTGAPDTVAFAETGADASGDGVSPCTCSMEYGPCGDANPCGCCVTGQGLVCTGDHMCVITVRRPFLVGASLRSARSVARADWTRELSAPSTTLDERTASALHRAWLDDALQEHASVAAFSRFTLQLLAVGAPPELIVASQRASLDEIAHARACFGLAQRYGGCSIGPSSLDIHDALGRTSLVSLAELTAQEGCAGETLGAALAAEQLALAKDREVVAVLRKIAADELRHAELAWRFARWAVTRGGQSVWLAIERAVRHAITETRRIPMRDYGVDDAAWNAHGRLTCVQAHQAHERAIAEVVEPCLFALASVAAQQRGRPQEAGCFAMEAEATWRAC